MGTFFDDTMQGLLEAVEIEKGNIPASTFSVSMKERDLIQKITVTHHAFLELDF